MSTSKTANASHITEYSLQCAKDCFSRAKFGRAFAHLLLVLKLSPDKKGEPDIKTLFSTAFQCFTGELENGGRVEDLLKCCEQVFEVFPECDSAFNIMGACLFRLGYVDEASDCFHQVLKINPNHLRAQENLDNLNCHLVERWHFRMLNDKKRNLAYRNAISRAVADGYSSVLDIGTGTGLLSMFAVEAGAEMVYGCEMSKTMYELSCNVLAANNVRDRVQMIHKNSTDIEIPKDMQERVSLIVTETFDAGLLGEHILTSLQHAQLHLLAENESCSQIKKKGKIIPSKAALHVCCIECDAVHKENRLLYSRICNIDFSSVTIACNTGVNEPYTSEMLNCVQGGYKELTERKQIKEFDFNSSLDVIMDHENGNHKENLSVIQEGRLDAIAVWFDLHLDDEVSLSSAPEAKSCWEQAIFPVHPFHFAESGQNENLALSEGNLITINGILQNSVWTVMCSSISEDERELQSALCSESATEQRTENAKLSSGFPQNQFAKDSPVEVTEQHTMSSQFEKHLDLSETTADAETHEMSSTDLTANRRVDALCNGDLKQLEPAEQTQTKQIFYLEREEVGKLNDMDFNKAYYSALCKIKEQKSSDFALYDISQGVSVLILHAAKLGAQKVEAKYMNSNLQTVELLKILALRNEISEKTLQFVEKSNENITKWATVLLTDIVEPCGVIHQQVAEDILLARQTCLRPDAVLVPGKVSVYGMLIESESLLKDSCVQNDNSTAGFKLADLMNSYQAKTHQGIDLCTLEYKRLSSPFPLFTLDTSSNDVNNYLSDEKEITVDVTQSGSVTAIVYWFELTLVDDITLCTYSENSHWKQAAAMQNAGLVVTQGSQVCVKAVCDSGSIHLKID